MKKKEGRELKGACLGKKIVKGIAKEMIDWCDENRVPKEKLAQLLTRLYHGVPSKVFTHTMEDIVGEFASAAQITRLDE